ncbi:unnamed protein product [Taenia asiatica]|uniref:Protein tweety homolog n=1 Tax=Taenia asiatica TaxID=60517 RepID=A0A0R3WG92_TAEAS|nr:unnamed protein product [Taenia asiatica]
MAWVIRTENGGLLNVLFHMVSLSTDHDLEFDLISEVDAPTVEFFRKMLLFQPLPLPVLQAMPRSLGGSQAAVNNAHANPNRGPHIFWTTVLAFLLSIVLIILLQVINCCCCCYKEKDPHNSMNALQMVLLRSKFTNKQFILRVVHTVVLILTLVFLAASIILLIVYFSSTGLVVAYLETNPQPSVGNQTPVSLPDGLRATVVLASSFVHKGISGGRALTSTTIHDFLDRIYAKTRGEVLDAFERLLAYLGVINALEKGEKFVEVMRSLLTLLIDIYGDVTLLYNEITSLETKLDAARITITQALGSVSNCSHWDLCKRLNIKAFWDDAQSRADKLLKQLNDTVKSVETQIRKYVHDIRIGYFVVGGVFMVMLTIATLIAMRLVYRAIHDRLFAPPNTAFNALMRFDVGEGCTYLRRRSAVGMSDFVVNGYVARQWKPFISSAVGRGADFLNTSPPRNIIHALTQTCSGEASQHPVGLLSALGYHNLIDVPKLVNSPELTQAIKRGKEYALTFPFSVSDYVSLRHIVELISDINLAITITSMLEQILEDIKNLTGYADVSNWTFSKPNEVLAKALESVRKIKSGLEQTHQSLKQLDSRKWDILDPLDELISALNVSRNAFSCDNSCFLSILNPHPPCLIAFQAAEGDKLANELEKEYDNLASNMIDYMKVDGEATFAQLTASLFPCQEAHTAYSLAIGVTCGETGGVHLLIGLSYILALNVLFLTFLYFVLFILAFFQALQIRMLNDVARDDDDDSFSKF